MPTFQPQALEGFLYCLQYQGKRASEAHRKLLEVTKTELWTHQRIKNFFADIIYRKFTIVEEKERFNEYATLRGYVYCMVRQEALGEKVGADILYAPGLELFPRSYVDTMYKRCIDGDYDMTVKEDILASFPHAVHVNVMKHLDTESRLTIGYTSHQYRALIDRTPHYLTKFHIFYGEDSIQIRTSDGFNVKYSKRMRKHKEYCRFQNKKKVRYELGSYRRNATRNLDEILNWPMLVIEELRIQETRHFDYEEDITEILNKCADIQGTFENLDQPLKVKKLTIIQADFSGVDAYFSQLDADYIKKLEVTRYTKPPLEDGTVLSNTYAHLNVAKFEVKSHLSIEQVIMMKTALLLNPNLIEIHMKVHMTTEMLNELSTALGAEKLPVLNECLLFAHFDYIGEGMDGKKLLLFMREDMIWFVGPKHNRDQLPVAGEEVVVVDDDEDSSEGVVGVEDSGYAMDSDEDEDSKEGILQTAC